MRCIVLPYRCIELPFLPHVSQGHWYENSPLLSFSRDPPVILAVVSGDPGLSLLPLHACGSAWNRTLDSRFLFLSFVCCFHLTNRPICEVGVRGASRVIRCKLGHSGMAPCRSRTPLRPFVAPNRYRGPNAPHGKWGGQTSSPPHTEEGDMTKRVAGIDVGKQELAVSVARGPVRRFRTRASGSRRCWRGYGSKP